MFVRVKKSGKYEYLQVVHNQRRGGKVHQQVIATLGRLDVLQKTGQLDSILVSCGRFAQHTAVLSAHKKGKTSLADTVKIGPPLVFERLWQELKIPDVIEDLLKNRKFEFSLERAIFVTVLHRLFASGSDRAAEVWYKNYAVKGAEGLQLHHFYRAMAWLGEELDTDKQFGATPFSPRTNKDLIEERLFSYRKDMFSTFDLAFFDTTSIYFEGKGGETLGQYGHSKDHRPDCKQIVVAAVLDQDGRPVCCEIWPGNTTDVKTLIPLVDRFKARFGIQQIYIVADRGMISKENIQELQNKHPQVGYILGAPMRLVNDIKNKVISRGGRYQEVYGTRHKSKDPSPLKVKEVWVEKKRYIVCYNSEQAEKDKNDREAIVAALKDKLKKGDKGLVGNKGYRKYLKTTSGSRFAGD